MAEISWELLLSEICRRIGEPGILKVFLLVPLLDGELEVVAAFSPTEGIDREAEGLRITPPEEPDWSGLCKGILLEKSKVPMVEIVFPLERIPGKFLFAITPAFPFLFVFVLSEDIGERIREVLRKYSLPLSALLETWAHRNRTLLISHFLFSFVSLLESIDAYTYHHSLRVAVLSEQVASRLGLSGDEQETARFSGLIHDLGKLFVPREILLKPGKLTEREFEEVKRHVLELDRMFLGNKLMEPYVLFARYHHERLDGSGYLGLRGEEIPLLSQILAVCDVFDALAHHRPYREAYSLEGTIRELTLLGETGKLNKGIVEALLQEIPEYYLSPLEGETVPLFPGLEVTLRRIREGKEEVYFGRVGESEEEKTVILFHPQAPSLEPGEEVLISYELSYLTVEAKAKYLFGRGNRHLFLLGQAVRRRKGFVLPWDLEVRFLKLEGDVKNLPHELMKNPGNLKRARTEAIGGERMMLLVKDQNLQVGDRICVLLTAYGEHFIIPGRVTRVEDLGFARRVLLEEFALPEREIDRLYGLIFRRQAELRRGFARYPM
ncbi:MAG: HD domain-containing protein [Candidatus Caldatribacterium sp.]|nr:HD domain-containing protein [Candidatus Caldatribacterium sp.]